MRGYTEHQVQPYGVQTRRRTYIPYATHSPWLTKSETDRVCALCHILLLLYEYSQIQGPAATLLNCNAISGGIAMDTLHSKVIIALTWLITTHTKLNLDIFFAYSHGLTHIWHICIHRCIIHNMQHTHNNNMVEAILCHYLRFINLLKKILGHPLN